MSKRITVQFAVADNADAATIRETLARGIETGFDEVTLLAVNENIDEIAKEVRVCPKCGSESFNAVRNVRQKYYCNSEGLPYSVVSESWSGQFEAANRPDSFQCSVCTQVIRTTETVPEWFFHNVICNEDWDDTVLVVVPDRSAEEINEILELTEPSVGWPKDATLEKRSAEFLGGEYRARIILVNSGPPSVDITIYKKGSQEAISVLEESPTYFGTFEFHLRDQLTPDGDQFDRSLRLIVMSESDLQNIQEPEDNPVTNGNTTGNETEEESE